MSFCKSRVHSFLGFSFSTTDYPVIPPPSPPSPPPPSLLYGGGLGGFIAATSAAADDTSGALESKNRDLGRIGFLDEVGGCVDGLSSCTESLGFESSDERQPEGSGGEEEEVRPPRAPARTEKAWKVAGTSTAEVTTKRSERKYPPPLTSMRRDGQRSFILRPVRKDGRLELTEVAISRPPEILQASREDGRLRLRLVARDQEEDPEEEEEDLNLSTSASTSSESEIQWYSKEEEEINREAEEEDGAWVIRRCNDEEAAATVGVGQDDRHQGRQPHEVHVWRQQHCVV